MILVAFSEPPSKAAWLENTPRPISQHRRRQILPGPAHGFEGGDLIGTLPAWMGAAAQRGQIRQHVLRRNRAFRDGLHHIAGFGQAAGAGK